MSSFGFPPKLSERANVVESLKLTNFQAHADLSLDLRSPITTIIGPSDTGKSAILRALRWLMVNRPLGGAFLRNGARNVRVEAVIDGVPIIRALNGSTNLYQIGDAQYKAFQRDVPEDLAKFLLVAESLNFQGQHDAPFWFCESPAEVSRQLNQIVNLELIDRTMSKLDSLLRSSRVVVGERTEKLQAARTERKRLRFVPALEEGLKNLKLFSKERDSAEAGVLFLSDLCEKTIHLRRTVRQLQSAIEQGEATEAAGKNLEKMSQEKRNLADLLETAEENYQTANMKLPAVEELEKKAAAVTRLTKERAVLSTLLEAAEGLAKTANMELPDLGNIEKLAQSLTQTRIRTQALRQLLDCLETAESEIRTAQASLKKTEAEFFKVSGGRCPLCQSPLPKS